MYGSLCKIRFLCVLGYIFGCFKGSRGKILKLAFWGFFSYFGDIILTLRYFKGFQY